MKTDPIRFDLTNHLKLILKNEVWNRKFEYGFNSGLKNTNPDEIKSVSAIIYPRFFSGYVNEKRLAEIIESACGKIPPHLHIDSYKDWSHHIGTTIIEIEYYHDVEDIPTKSDFKDYFYLPKIDRNFIEQYHRHIAVLKEIASFFLAGLHLSFPTKSFAINTDSPLKDGFSLMSSKRRKYGSKLATSAFMHEIYIETSKLSNVISNLEGIAKIWHLNLWPLKRFLVAVESDQISMDYLLDLIFALEGLFEKQASSDFIKIFCLKSLCLTRKEAKEIKDILDLSYKLRNDMVHGERTYDLFDKVKLGGKEILAQDVYWQMKGVVAVMIIKAMSKLIKTPGMKNLRFVEDDLVNAIFEKK